MSGRVWRRGGEVFKRLDDSFGVPRLVERTGAARASLVPTPAARATAEPGVVAFTELRGTGGLALVAELGTAVLAELLRPLAALHGAEVAGLPAFDPLLRIAPRIGPATPGWIGREIADCLDATPSDAAPVVLHGDFHAGQVIRDGAGTVWLLGLDDIAAGPAEADLGNFAAHLATRPETRRGPVRAGFESWLAATLAAYPDGGDAGLAQAFGRLALIRRALKLHDGGDPSVLDELASAAGQA